MGLIEFKFDREHYSRQMQMYEWCCENCGPGGWDPDFKAGARWRIYTQFGYTHFYFADEKDASAFALKWT